MILYSAHSRDGLVCPEVGCVPNIYQAERANVTYVWIL